MTRERTPYRMKAWRTQRLAVLERDGWRCQWGRNPTTGEPIEGEDGPCLAEATDADHIIPWRDCPDERGWIELWNLRGLCKSHNSSRSANQKHHRGWERRSDVDIVLARPGTEITPDADDIVLDLERLAAALSPSGDIHPRHRTTARTAWDQILYRLRRGDMTAGRVWLITDEPAANYPHHTVIAPPAVTKGVADAEKHSIGGRW